MIDGLHRCQPHSSRAGQRRQRRRRTQRYRHCSTCRGRPHIPLLPPLPALTNPRHRNPANYQTRHQPWVYPLFTANRPARHPAALHTHGRKHPTTRDPRLPEILGEHAWRATGLGSPIDIDEFSNALSLSNNKSSSYGRNSKERD